MACQLEITSGSQRDDRFHYVPASSFQKAPTARRTHTETPFNAFEQHRKWFPTSHNLQKHQTQQKVVNFWEVGPFRHVKPNFLFIYFYLLHIQICLAGRVWGLLAQEAKPDFLLDRPTLGLRSPSPWVSSQFVDEMVWKRSRLLSCTLSQNKQRAPMTEPALSRRPPCSGRTNPGRSGLRTGWDGAART